MSQASNQAPALRRSGAMALALFAAALVSPCAAQTFQTLYDFPDTATEGAVIEKGVVLDATGNAYGVATDGVKNCADAADPGLGCGGIFQLSSANRFKLILRFAGANGASPAGNLALNGPLLYSTTLTGGVNDLGAVYEVKKNGSGLKLLHQFDGTDGDQPNTTPRFDAAGDIFSSTPFGGPAYTGPGTGFGVLYEITKAGDYIVDHDFSGGADGGQPGRPFIDKSGNIFEGTVIGGSCDSTTSGCGVVYEYTSSTGDFQVLHTFATLDGADPGVADIDSHGDIFGISYTGGANNDGTIWELTPNGDGTYAYAKLWDFTGGADGSNPYIPLSSKGVLYGTSAGGGGGYGVLWSYTKKTGVVQLHSFSGGDGLVPAGTPVMNKSGALIGTTAYGGTGTSCTTTWGQQIINYFGCGTIYSYLP